MNTGVVLTWELIFGDSICKREGKKEYAVFFDLRDNWISTVVVGKDFYLIPNEQFTNKIKAAIWCELVLENLDTLKLSLDDYETFIVTDFFSGDGKRRRKK